MKEFKKIVTNLENREYRLSNEKLQQVLIETIKFIVSNIIKFKKRPKQLSAKKINDKNREKVRQNKKKLKSNINKILKVKKSNTISKIILVEKEKSGKMRNFRNVLSPFSSTSVPSPSSSTDVSSPFSSTDILFLFFFTDVQSVLLSKGIFDKVPESQAKKATQKKNITISLQN